MITLVDINKRYNEQIVIQDFSYSFQNTGFYLFFGPSGCGKTTLANIIFGVTKQDCGSVIYSDDLRCNETQGSVQSCMGYVTQDSYFIDYLTIREHFKLNNYDEKEISELLIKFSLTHVLDQYPSTLSGGEKQRVSIIMALGQKKKVLILDEPTSALNFENKRLVFYMLHELRKKILIICISHDVEAQLFCDYIIDFRNLPNHSMGHNEQSDLKSCKGEQLPKRNKVNLYPYIRKQTSYKDGWRLSKMMLTIIIMLSFLMIYICANPKEKIVNSLEETYHLNYLYVDIPIENETQLNVVKNYKGVNEVVYDYNFSGIYNTEDIDGISTSSNNSIAAYGSLPVSKSFYYNDHLEVGRYFEKSNEIILGSNYQELSKFSSSIEKIKGKEHSELIGQTIQLDTNKGKKEFIIVGVFKPFSNEESKYFTYITENEDDLNATIYMNGLYTNTYYFDDIRSSSEESSLKSRFFVYFDDYMSMENFINEYGNIENSLDKTEIYAYPISHFLTNVLNILNRISQILLPLSICSGMISLLFYIQSTSIFLQSNKHVFGIYRYYGFQWKDIKRGYFKYYVYEIIKSFFYALVLSIVAMIVVNQINTILLFWPYNLMDFNVEYVFFFVSGLFILFVIFINIVLNKLKHINWYDLIRKERDLL